MKKNNSVSLGLVLLIMMISSFTSASLASADGGLSLKMNKIVGTAYLDKKEGTFKITGTGPASIVNLTLTFNGTEVHFAEENSLEYKFDTEDLEKYPANEMLKDIDVLVFDIQDVGVRFYTYLSTLHYVMEACAENNVPLMILDRPNPNLVSEPDGPMLDLEFSSFIGLHPVPVLYGLTIGEYGQMINGEGWLAGGLKADVSVIPCGNYSRSDAYELPIAPSPNLPNQKSIELYPSLCFLEGTVVSIGRGTDYPFQIVGHPDFKFGSYTFTPMPNSGSKHPKLEGEECFGLALSEERANKMRLSGRLDLSFLLDFYEALSLSDDFFREDGYFNLLAGTDVLREQVQSGMTEEAIRATWQEDLQRFSEMYTKYWIYN